MRINEDFIDSIHSEDIEISDNNGFVFKPLSIIVSGTVSSIRSPYKSSLGAYMKLLEKFNHILERSLNQNRFIVDKTPIVYSINSGLDGFLSSISDSTFPTESQCSLENSVIIFDKKRFSELFSLKNGSRFYFKFKMDFNKKLKPWLFCEMLLNSIDLATKHTSGELFNIQFYNTNTGSIYNAQRNSLTRLISYDCRESFVKNFVKALIETLTEKKDDELQAVIDQYLKEAYPMQVYDAMKILKIADARDISFETDKIIEEITIKDGCVLDFDKNLNGQFVVNELEKLYKDKFEELRLKIDGEIILNITSPRAHPRNASAEILRLLSSNVNKMTIIMTKCPTDFLETLNMSWLKIKKLTIIKHEYSIMAGEWPKLDLNQGYPTEIEEKVVKHNI